MLVDPRLRACNVARGLSDWRSVVKAPRASFVTSRARYYEAGVLSGVVFPCCAVMGVAGSRILVGSSAQASATAVSPGAADGAMRCSLKTNGRGRRVREGTSTPHPSEPTTTRRGGTELRSLRPGPTSVAWHPTCALAKKRFMDRETRGERDHLTLRPALATHSRDMLKQSKVGDGRIVRGSAATGRAVNNPTSR